MATLGWFGVRCVFKLGGHPEVVYEERVTVWRASGAQEAIELAETEAGDYIDGLDAECPGLAQAYAMADELGAGAEVLSVMRTSSLQPPQCLSSYFETGLERQTHIAVPESP